MNVGTAVFRAVADFQSVVKESGRASSALDDLAGTSEKSSSRVMGFLGGLAKTAALAGVATGSIFAAKSLAGGYKRLATIEDSTAALTVQLGDAKEAASLLDQVMTVVTGTPYKFESFGAAATQMVGFGVEVNKIPKYLTAIGEAAATQGKGAQDAADGMTTAFGRAQALGRITGQTINALSDRGVNALAILANHYGVSTAEAQKMVTKGIIPAAEGMDVLADGILNGSDGVAGATVAFEGTMAGLRETMTGASGGFKSAMDRFGASVLGPFQGLITEGFQQAAGAIDKAGKWVNGALTRLVESGTAKAVLDRLRQIPAAVTAVTTLLTQGFTPAVREAMGWEEDSKIVDQILKIRDGFTGLRDLLLKGDFTSALREAFGWEEDSGVVDLLLRIRSSAQETFAVIGRVGTLLGGAVKDLAPALGQIAGSLAVASAAIGVSVWDLFLVVLEAVAEILVAVVVPMVQALADWMSKNQAAVTVLVGAYTAWRVAALGLKVIQGVMAAITAAKAAYTAATYGASGATYAFAGAQNASKASLIGARLAMVAYRIQMIAAAVATKAVTAAQWLLNAAMSANPIMLIILAIVALVAGFIWLWNNVEGFRNFFIAAWQWIQGAVQAVADWFMNTLVPFFQSIWDGIVAGLTWLWELYVSIWTGIYDTVMTVVQAISDFIQTVWNAIVGFFTTVFNTIKTIVTTYFTVYKTIILGVFNAVKSFIQTVWNAIKSIVTGAVNAVKSVISGIGQIVSKVVGFFTKIKDGIQQKFTAAVNWVKGIPGKIIGALGNTGKMLWDSGKKIIGGLTDGIKSMAKKVKDTVGNVLGGIRNLLPFSPAKEGPFSGRGWTTYAGRSIVQALGQGMLNAEEAAVDPAEQIMARAREALNGGLDVNALIRPTGMPSSEVSGSSAARMGALAGAGAGGGVQIGTLTVNNPRPERTTGTLAQVARGRAYVGVGSQ